VRCQLDPLAAEGWEDFHFGNEGPQFQNYVKLPPWPNAVGAPERLPALWSIRKASSPRPIGVLGLRAENGPFDPSELFCLITPSARGEGLGEEVARSLLSQLEGTMERVVTRAAIGSRGAARLLDRLGFKPMGQVPAGEAAHTLWEYTFSEKREQERTRLAALGQRTLEIATSWDGATLARDRACVDLRFRGGQLEVDIEAPFHGDPPPAVAPGSCPKLWEHEVVEVFLLGQHENYLELEFGPHGHYLVLQLSGRRQLVRQGMPLAYTAHVTSSRFLGHACVPLAWLPPAVSAVNAYAIHGRGAARRYETHRPCGGLVPDFHRLETFAPLF
jgi:hypothetical protein